jgi:hypothetical protein
VADEDDGPDRTCETRETSSRPRKPWTSPRLITSLLNDAEIDMKGTRAGDYVVTGTTYGS